MPQEAILKENLLRLGMSVTPAGLEAARGKRLITIIMIGGSIVRKVQGGPDNAADFNAPYVAAIRERIGHRVLIVTIAESQPMDRLKVLLDAGFTCHNANLEVWDERLFKWLAPGKDHCIGCGTWVRRLYDAVEAMGEGCVSPNMVSGIEMAKPYGFETVKEAVASTRDGFETLMSRGVIPHLDTWCIEPGMRLSGNPPVSLDSLIQASRRTSPGTKPGGNTSCRPSRAMVPWASPSTATPPASTWGAESPSPTGGRGDIGAQGRGVSKARLPGPRKSGPRRRRRPRGAGSRASRSCRAR